MNYKMEFDPERRVFRFTSGKILTEEIFLDAYEAIHRFALAEGPFFGIADFTPVEQFLVSTDFVRSVARKPPAIPAGRLRVIVAPQAEIYGMARMVELMRDGMNGEFHVVHTIDAAYALLGFSSLNFSRQIETGLFHRSR